LGGYSFGVDRFCFTNFLARLSTLKASPTPTVSNHPSLNSSPTKAALQNAKAAFQSLRYSDNSTRNRGIEAIARSFARSSDEILEANTLDLEIGREMAIADIILEWLKLTPERLENTVEILQRLATSPAPSPRLLRATYQIESRRSYYESMPLGTIALIYEAIPELGAIAAGMCLKTGNSLILRGCTHTTHSNAAIVKLMQNALAEAEFPNGCIEYLSPESGSKIAELVTQDKYLDLILPYGRPGWVQQVTEKATVPSISASIGNCYLYWSASGDFDLVKSAIIDSHDSNPDPVNAIEKVAIDVNQKPTFLVRLFNILQENGFQLRGDSVLVQEFPEYLTLAAVNEWNSPYLNRTVAFKSVGSLTEAIDWIDRHSSSHADCIITDSYEESQQFAQNINSALIYLNTSPRFDRCPPVGDAVFLGVSNQKGNCGGAIGLEAFTRDRQIFH
jgi:glutamate-5-semialdehyde dehydrogenase